MKNKKYFISLFIVVLILIGVIFKISYSYFDSNNNSSKETKYNASFGCLSLNINEESNDIKYYYPMKDRDVQTKIDPIELEINNTCKEDKNYIFTITSFKNKNNIDYYLEDKQIKITIMKDDEVIMQNEYLDNINVFKNGNVYDNLHYKYNENDEYKELDNIIIYKLNDDVIKGETKEIYTIYLWIDYYEGDKNKNGDYDNSTYNKLFKYQLDINE